MGSVTLDITCFFPLHLSPPMCFGRGGGGQPPGGGGWGHPGGQPRPSVPTYGIAKFSFEVVNLTRVAGCERRKCSKYGSKWGQTLGK